MKPASMASWLSASSSGVDMARRGLEIGDVGLEVVFLFPRTLCFKKNINIMVNSMNHFMFYSDLIIFHNSIFFPTNSIFFLLKCFSIQFGRTKERKNNGLELFSCFKL